METRFDGRAVGARKALVVGIDGYSGRHAPLECCVNDATQISGLLAEEEYGFEVTTLTEEYATRPAIMRWAAEARSSRSELVLFYFSGHGVATDLGTYLVTADNAMYDEGIEIQKLITVLAGDQEARHDTLVLLDCCHSGVGVTLDETQSGTRPISNDDLRVNFANERAIAVLAASLSSQVAWEQKNHGHGVFTYHLLQALYGEAADHEGFVTINSIYEVISRNMSQLVSDRERQKPVFRAHVPGRLVLAAGMTPCLAPPVPEATLRQLEQEGQQMLDAFLQFKMQYGSAEWRNSGYELACRRLELIYQWFEKRAALTGMLSLPGFRQSRETLNRYRTELGLVETDMRIKEGVLSRQIGTGGFGTVWQVDDRDSGTSIAYKIYHTQEMQDATKVKRFTNGYQAMTLLSHPNIVKVHRFSSCPVGFTMDYIEGANLRDLEPKFSLDGPAVLVLLIDIAEAVKHAHDHDVIHRDIKPENIVCRLSPEARQVPFLTDFDLAWFSTRTQTATQHAIGVIAYAAPEQYSAFNAKASGAKTPALDVFSFGQLLYFCFTGKDPDPVDLSRNLETLQREVKGIGSNEFVRQIGGLYKDSTEWHPGDRIQSFEEVLNRLRRIQAELENTDTDIRLSEDSFLSELIYQLTRDPREPGDPSFISHSGNWIVHLAWHTKLWRKETTPALVIEFTPQGRIGLENVSNEQMRRVLNERVNNKLRHHKPFANLRKGNRGAYQVFVEFGPVTLSRNGIEPVAGAIRSTLEALDG
ncbi:protein kinase domain-containing protein [Micromonospora sp. DT48]|uniref:protein kinase domain-containing protein n=1 Tax=unclassified Micromonospora TaxID=2617518 RepID=UPI0012BC82F1|nr:caspase family protein [Micromonospora sp. CP22]MTK03826.1 hypothetical protein [Micromonospora sp. CP22]